MKIFPNERWILLGARRGLGKSFLDLVASDAIEILALSRKIDAPIYQNVQTERADFSVKENWPPLVERFGKFLPTRIFYFAGGGPYGRFEDKAWQDHEWAWKLNFEFPAFLLHQILRVQSLNESVRQVTFIGSSIAESSADPMAASYAAAKHALKGLVSTVQWEQKDLNSKGKTKMDVRLFSPGYMDTLLLPTNAWPRQQAELVRPTEEISKILLDWIQNPDDANGHLACPSQIKLK